MKRSETIRIAGAGPAGLTAAVNLAKAGYTVEVHERGRDAGRFFFGDMQGLENWSEDEDVLDSLSGMQLAINFIATPFTDLKVLNSSRSWRFCGNRPAFYLVRRGTAPGSLDQGLKEQALACGVKIHFQSRLAENAAHIVATGALKGHIFGVDRGEVFETDLPDMAIGLVSDRAAYKGYAYLLVMDGYGCLCSVLFDRFHLVNRCYDEAKRIFAREVDLSGMKNCHKVGGIGGYLLKNRFVEQGRLYVGEAAGLQDLLWGFGMRSAMRSGYLAAQAIIHNTDYKATARKVFEPRQKAGLVNRFLWEGLSFNDYGFIINRIQQAEDHLSLFGDFFNLNRMQRLLLPLAKLALRKRYRLFYERNPKKV